MSRKKQPKSRIVRKKRLRRKFWFIIPLLVLLVCGGWYVTNLYNKAEKAMDNAYEEDVWEGSETREEDVDPDVDNVSILLLGIDQNDARKQNEIPRSDAMVVATLNKEAKSIKLLSIPRDSLVYIPQVGYEDKINHAYAFGEAAKVRGEAMSGTRAAIETVQELLDIPIDYYVNLNFDAFIEVINAIGGINIEVPYTISELDSQDNKNSIYLEPGFQSLNGEEALALARTRKKDSDFERGKRQMEIIDAIIKKSTSFSSIFKYGDVIEALGDNMGTNMSFEDMKSFFSYAKGLNVDKITLDGENYQPEGIYYWKIDDEALVETQSELQNHLDITRYADSDKDNVHSNSGREQFNAESN